MLLIQQTAAQSVGLDAMHAPDALLNRIAAIPSMATGSRRLVMLLTQLGDFDSMEYTQPVRGSKSLQLLGLVLTCADFR